MTKQIQRCGNASRGTITRLNILFIIDDQHRWDYLQSMQP